MATALEVSCTMTGHRRVTTMLLGVATVALLVLGLDAEAPAMAQTPVTSTTVDPYARAWQLHQAGYDGEARDAAREALQADPSRPIPAQFRAPPRSVADRIDDAAGAAASLLAAAGILLGVAALVLAVAVLPIGWWLWRRPRPRVAIGSFTVSGTDEVSGDDFSQAIADELGNNGSGHRINRLSDAASNTGVELAKVLGDTWGWLAPILGYLKPRKVLTVSGHATVVAATEERPAEVTISLAISDFRGRCVNTRAFSSRAGEVVAEDLLRALVPRAAAWLVDQLRAQGAVSDPGWFGTCEWWSWGQFREGVWYAEHGYPTLVEARYRSAVTADLRNCPAWLNLAALHGRRPDGADAAIQELDSVKSLLEKRNDDRLWLRYLKVRTVALLNRASSPRDGSDPRGDRCEARDCAARLVREIARRQREFELEDGSWPRARRALLGRVPGIGRRVAAAKDRQPDLHELVDANEGSAVALLASAALHRDRPQDVDTQPLPAGDRATSLRALASIRVDADVNAVLGLLAGLRTDGRGGDRPACYDDALDTSAHYNLGCLYAKAAGDAPGTAVFGPYVAAALYHIGRGVAGERDRAAFARDDPELRGLRQDPAASEELERVLDKVAPRPVRPTPAGDGWKPAVRMP